MARVCDLCLKAADAGNRRPWSKKATRCVRKVNTQKLTVATQGGKLRIKICSSCRRTLSKPPRIKGAAKKALAAAEATA